MTNSTTSSILSSSDTSQSSEPKYLLVEDKHRQMFNYSLSLAWYPNLAQWSSKRNHNNNNNNQNTNHKSLHPNKSPFTLEWDQKTYEKQDLNHCNRILSPYGKRQKICYR